jgi:O-antigen/teichoic acid export membrane protein
MDIKKTLSLAILIQCVGAGSSALTNVVMARRFGPEAQGILASSRSWIDLVSQGALLGLPQALGYGLCSRSLPAPQVVSFAAVYAFLALCGGVLFAGFVDRADPALSIAIIGMLIYGLYRSIILAEGSNAQFNCVSIVPNALTLCGISLLRSADTRAVRGALAWAGSAAAITAVALLGRKAFPRSRILGIRHLKDLFRYGSWYIAVSLVVKGTIVITYELLRRGPNGQWMVGMFSIPMLLMSTATLPVDMIGPVLLKYWSAEFAGVDQYTTLIVLTHAAALLALFVGPLLALSSWYLVPMMFGPQFQPAVVPSAIIVLAAYPLIVSRLLGTAMLAANLPRDYALISMLRGMLIVFLVGIGLSRSLEATTLAWVLGECLFLFVGARILSAKTGNTFLRAVGLDCSVWRRIALSSYRLAFTR